MTVQELLNILIQMPGHTKVLVTVTKEVDWVRISDDKSVAIAGVK